MSTYFETGFTKAQLDTAQADTTSAIGINDVIRGILPNTTPILHNEYYQAVYRNSSDIGWQVADKDSNLDYSTGQPLEIYDDERGTYWEKIDLSTVDSSNSGGGGGGTDTDEDGVNDTEDYFYTDPYETVTKTELESFGFDSTSEIADWDRIKFITNQGDPESFPGLIPGEFYLIGDAQQFGWRVVGRDGAQIVDGNFLQVYSADRGVLWEKLASTPKTNPQLGPSNLSLVEQITNPVSGPDDISLIEELAEPQTGPNDISLIEELAEPQTGPINTVLIFPTQSEFGPSNINVSVEAPYSGPENVTIFQLPPDVGPKDSKISNLPLLGPEKIQNQLLPSVGPEQIVLQDSRAVPVEEISSQPVIPNKGSSFCYKFPETGPEGTIAIPEAFSVKGYYPLYRTSKAADLTSPLKSHHTHYFDGVTYYMPNGLDKVWHGDFEGPKKGPSKIGLAEVVRGRTKTPKYISHIYDTRASALTGPFTYEGITAVTSRDHSSELFGVNDKHEIVKSKLNDLKDSEFKFPSHRLNVEHKFDLETEEGVVASEKGEFMYRGKFLSSPFADDLRIEGEIENPLFFKKCYLAVAETNWMHLGSEAALKELYRVDLTFAESSLGHVWLYAMNESKKVSGQYKGEIRDNMKVFTNLRGKRFKIKMFVATHKDFPWSMREMSLGYNQGKNF